MADTPAPGAAPPLSEAYHHARKGYALVAGLLMGWELVGIELTEAPLDSVHVKLLNPAAAPLVLIAVTLYFAARITLEWFQLHDERRAHPAAIVDFALAHMMGIGAVALYAIQRALERQLSPYLLSLGFDELIGGVVFGLIVAIGLRLRWYRNERGRIAPFKVGLFVFFILISLANPREGVPRWYFPVAVIAGVIAGRLALSWLDRQSDGWRRFAAYGPD